MNNLFQQYQHIPKLQKTKQLINPYQSNTSATTQSQLSRIFLLNNRNKVSLSESQSQDEKQVDHSKAIIPTFSRFLTFERTYIQSQAKIDEIYEPQQVDNREEEIYHQSIQSIQNSKQLQITNKINMNSNYSVPCTTFPSHSIQGYYNKGIKKIGQNKIYTEPEQREKDYKEKYDDNNAQSTKNANNSKYNVSFKQNITKQDPLPIKTNPKYTSSFDHINANKIDQKQQKPITSTRVNNHFTDDNPSSQQQIADQQVTQNITSSKCSHILNMNKSIHSVKPSLNSASRVHLGDMSSRRGSIIDQIKQHHFAQSNVIDHNDKDIVRDSKNQKAKTVEDYALIDEGTQTKKIRRRTKIFYQPKYKIDKRQKYIENHSQQAKPKSFSKGFKQNKEETISYENKVSNNQESAEKKQKGTHECSYKNACKQTQCHLKLLNIVDKLTDKPVQQYSTRHSKKEQMIMIQRNIQSQFLFLSLQVNELSISLTLHKILDSDMTGKVNELKIKIQILLDKIKNVFELNSILSGDKCVIENQNRWQLFDKLQKMCQTLHYIQIVQQRYKLLRSKLKYLKEQIRDIIRVQKSEQIKKIGEIIRLMKQLQSSKFYGSQSHVIGLVKSYNIFIEGQVQQLNQTVECLKNDILSS